VSETRNLAAIFAANIAGHSSMMGADENGTVRKLKAVQPVVLYIDDTYPFMLHEQRDQFAHQVC
jgi:hypothetical protein